MEHDGVENDYKNQLLSLYFLYVYAHFPSATHFLCCSQHFLFYFILFCYNFHLKTVFQFDAFMLCNTTICNDLSRVCCWTDYFFPSIFKDKYTWIRAIYSWNSFVCGKVTRTRFTYRLFCSITTLQSNQLPV